MADDRNWILKDAVIRGNRLCLDLYYPRSENTVQIVELGLMDVRAADPIQISYDFDRDGYVIKQMAHIDRGDWMEEMDGWKEVAFIKAWGRDASEWVGDG